MQAHQIRVIEIFRNGPAFCTRSFYGTTVEQLLDQISAHREILIFRDGNRPECRGVRTLWKIQCLESGTAFWGIRDGEFLNSAGHWTEVKGGKIVAGGRTLVFA